MATGDGKENKDIPPGTKVLCTTCFDEKIEGEVVAFDYETKLVIISILCSFDELFSSRKVSQVVSSRGEEISFQERFSYLCNTKCKVEWCRSIVLKLSVKASGEVVLFSCNIWALNYFCGFDKISFDSCCSRRWEMRKLWFEQVQAGHVRSESFTICKIDVIAAHQLQSFNNLYRSRHSRNVFLKSDPLNVSLIKLTPFTT